MSNQYKGVRLHVCRLNLREKKLTSLFLSFWNNTLKTEKKVEKNVNAFLSISKLPPPPQLEFSLKSSILCKWCL